MRKGIKSIIFLVILSILAVQLMPAKASALWNPPTTPTVNAVYLVNADTGTVVYEKNQNKKIYPASVTKLMTAILVYEKYKDNLNTVVTVDKEDIRSLDGTYGSLVPLHIGEQLTIQELLYCLLVRSGDDSANVLARVTGGTVANFVAEMNEKAKEIGLKNTHYANPHGLQDPDHYTTAYDCYLLSKYAMGISELAKIVDTQRYVLPATNMSGPRTLINTNYVIDPNYRSFYYEYVKGIKTGTTTPAGACLVSYAEKNGVTYYLVTMGGVKQGSENTAFSETRALYQWVFGNFEIEPVVKTTDTAAQVNLDLAVQKTQMLLVPQTQLNALVPDNYTSSDLKITLHVPNSVRAPVTKGQKLGTEDVAYVNPQTKEVQKLGTINLVASEDAQLSKPLYALSLIKGFFDSIWFKVVAVLLILLLILYISLSVYYNRRKKRINRRRGKKYYYRR